MVVFVILCKTIENEFPTAYRFENIIKKFNLVDLVYQKCKGIQAYERAERRSVTLELTLFAFLIVSQLPQLKKIDSCLQN